jgi:DNA repair protein RecN (Recombination protein N)
LKSLKIQNLILIEKAEISLGPGLNILTGETGSGKSAVLSAIRLISGERADSHCIRKGADFAIVEALLENGTFIRREIYRSGKNRAFIDEAQVSLSALREAVNIERVDQTSSHTAFDEQKRMLDAFAHLEEEVDAHASSFAEEKKIEAELQKLLQTPKERELEWAHKDLSLIEQADWKEGEEEKLAEEHHFLTHAQELAEKMSGAAFLFSEGTEIPNIKRALNSLESCLKFDAKLTPLAQQMKEALLQLEDVGNSIQAYADRLEVDPNRLLIVEKRIGLIESLKRRFGSNIEAEKEKLLAIIEHLSGLDAQIEHLRKELQALKEKNLHLSESITQKRREAAPLFASQVLDELKALNLRDAKFEVFVGNSFNDVRFLFSANPGIAPIPLEECASGGEQSRLLLAIKTILADENSCLVFDEIDSNVGGQTATILGQKLKKLAERRQVICVTHFVQVARQATDHFLVSKTTQKELAYTNVIKLSETEREIEYSRMLGTAP